MQQDGLPRIKLSRTLSTGPKTSRKRCLSHQWDSCGSAELHSLTDLQLAAVHLHLRACHVSVWACVPAVTYLCADGRHKLPLRDLVEAGERNEIWNVSAKNTLTMETFLAKTFQIPFCSSLVAGRRMRSCWCVRNFFCLLVYIGCSREKRTVCHGRCTDRDVCAQESEFVGLRLTEHVNKLLKSTIWSPISHQESHYQGLPLF